MTKFLLILLSGIVFLIANFFHYKISAETRFEKALEYQSATTEDTTVLFDMYDFYTNVWVKELVFNDDKEVTYQYRYRRSTNDLTVFASSGNMSIELTDKKAKYVNGFTMYFKFNGEVKRVLDH